MNSNLNWVLLQTSTLNILTKIKLDKFNIQIDDKLLNEQLNDLAKRYGKMSEAQVAVEDDMLTGNFIEVDKHGNAY